MLKETRVVAEIPTKLEYVTEISYVFSSSNNFPSIERINPCAEFKRLFKLFLTVSSLFFIEIRFQEMMVGGLEPVT